MSDERLEIPDGDFVERAPSLSRMTDLERDFLRVAELCFALESAISRPRVVQRLARAFSMGIEKAFAVGWLKNEQVDPAASNPSVIRAAERGAREYLP